MDKDKRWPKEAYFQARVMKELRQLPNVTALKVIQATDSGVSDILCCVNGRFVAIELKADKGKPTPLQLLFLSKVTKAGGIARVCYTWGDVVTALVGASLEGAKL